MPTDKTAKQTEGACVFVSTCSNVVIKYRQDDDSAGSVCSFSTIGVRQENFNLHTSMGVYLSMRQPDA